MLTKIRMDLIKISVSFLFKKKLVFGWFYHITQILDGVFPVYNIFTEDFQSRLQRGVTDESA